MTLTKSDIIDNIQSQCRFSKIKSTEMVEKILETIKQSLESDEDVLVSGFGKFCVQDKGKRRINPSNDSIWDRSCSRII